MIVANQLTLTFVLVLLVLVGCNNGSTMTKVASSKSTPNNYAISKLMIDPCQVALAPQFTDHMELTKSRINRDIARYQQAVTHSKTPIPYLERLGWTFIAKAKHYQNARKAPSFTGGGWIVHGL